MTYQVLARKYRPQRFEDVVGQNHVTRTLTQSFANDRIGHAYIFSGPRGIGKTTTARLLAKLVNCDNPIENEPCDQCDPCVEIREGRSVDVREIDGASNNSVDQIRELRENVQYSPAHNRKKIYIIDEVHMLSSSAFNALLKTLEEPPEHVIFIFATTEIEQVPDTILSRCQRFDFRLIPLKKLVQALRDLCESEEIPVEQEALFLIARFAEGSLRDAQSILDQMINFTRDGEQRLTESKVSETWGLVGFNQLLTYLESVEAGQVDTVIQKLHQHIKNGKDLTSLLADLAEMVRNLTLLKQDADLDYLKKTLPHEVLSSLSQLEDGFTNTELEWTFSQLIELHDQIRKNSRFQLQLAEVGLIRIIRGRPRYNLAEITERLEQLEEKPEDSQSISQDNSSPSSSEKSKPITQENQDNQTTTTQPKSSNQNPNPRKNTLESQSASNEIDQETAIKKIIEKTPQPQKAYLKESNEIQLRDDMLIIRYKPKWKNHAQNVGSDESRETLRQVCEEVLQSPLEPQIQVEGSSASSAKQSSPQESHRVPNEPSDEETTDTSSRLLEQTKEIFDVKNVEKIEES